MITFQITFLGGLTCWKRGWGILHAQTWLLAWNVVWGLYSKLHPSRLVCRLPAAGLCFPCCLGFFGFVFFGFFRCFCLLVVVFKIACQTCLNGNHPFPRPDSDSVYMTFKVSSSRALLTAQQLHKMLPSWKSLPSNVGARGARRIQLLSCWDIICHFLEPFLLTYTVRGKKFLFSQVSLPGQDNLVLYVYGKDICLWQRLQRLVTWVTHFIFNSPVVSRKINFRCE